MWKYIFLFLSILCVFVSFSKILYDVCSDFASVLSYYFGKKVQAKFTKEWARVFWFILAALFICLTIYLW